MRSDRGQRDLVLSQVLEQILITDTANAVLDPLRAQAAKCLPDALGSSGLSRVWHAVQPGGSSAIELITRHRTRKAEVRAAEPKADQSGHIMIKSN